MGATYTRQSSYTDGDVISAAHTNDEFNQLLAAFQASIGHTHDGTANEGGAITKLLGNTLSFGDGTTDVDIAITFNANANDGLLTWKEDEDYFEFSDDILIASTEKLQFRDTAIYINSSADGQLDLVADTEIQIAATTIDMNGAVDISGNLDVGGNLVVTGTTTFNGGTITMGDAATDNVVFGADINSSIIPNTDSTFDLGSASQEWKDIYIDGVAYLDAINFNGTAISADAGELNTLDGITAVVGELNALDIGSTAIGTAIASKAVILDANKDYTGIRNLTTTGNVIVGGDIDLEGDIDVNGTLEADAITVAGVTLAETISDTVGAMVSGNTETNIAVSYDDADNTLDFVIGTLNQSTTGSAATLTTARTIGGTSFDGSANIAVALAADATTLETARTIHGVSFDGSANIDLSEVISDTVGAMVSSNTETGIAVTYQDADNTIDFVIGAGAIVNSMLADDAVGADELAANAVVTASIVDDNVTTAKLAADAVTGAEIADDAINSEHYTDGSIDLAHMSVNSIDSDQYVDGSIDTAHIANLQITTGLIAADAITNAKIADDAIDSEHYTDGSIDTAHISADAITEAKIADNAIESEHVNDNVISGQTALTSGIADADELLISDNGTIKRTDMSVIKTYIGAADDATALAIALG